MEGHLQDGLTEGESKRGGLISADKGDESCVFVWLQYVYVCVCVQQRLRWSERGSVLSLRSTAITAAERPN